MASIRQTVSGTFGATGTSAEIVGDYISIILDFGASPSASVDLEEQLPDGTWVKNPDATAVIADYRKVWQTPEESRLRLNCTAHTNDVKYVMNSVYDPKTVR